MTGALPTGVETTEASAPFDSLRFVPPIAPPCPCLASAAMLEFGLYVWVVMGLGMGLQPMALQP